MNTAWFLVLAFLMTGYAVLDGFDLGVGALLPWVCKDEKERLAARAAIGPVWNGNEVWLIAGGGAMFVAFPRLYASAFSGFYLALILVLWLLMGRGIGFEFRHAVKNGMWTGMWDAVFSASSLLLSLLLGVAVGNVLRGVPLDATGQFQGSFAIMLNPFALAAGLLSVAMIALHGAAFLALTTDGDLQQRCRRVARWLWGAALVLGIGLTAASFKVRPDFLDNFARFPVLWLVPIAAVAAFGAIPFAIATHRSRALFAATSVAVTAALGSAAAGLYPRLLPALKGSAGRDLTIYNTASGQHGLVVALILNVTGLAIACAYTWFIYRTAFRRISVRADA